MRTRSLPQLVPHGVAVALVLAAAGAGPGPSTIDLPEAGCWRFTLTWTTEGSTSADHGLLSDTLDLRYVRPAA